MSEILIGKTNDGIKIAVPNNLRCGHVQVIGSTGRGKTESVVIPWMMQDMFQGNRTVLIDGKGDKSIYTLLEAVNREEGLNEEICYFDIANICDSMTTNPLKHGTSQQIVDRIFSSLEFDNTYFKVVSEKACHLVVRLIHAQKEINNQEVKFKTLFEALTDDSQLSELFLGVSENLTKNFEGEMSQFLNQKFSDRQEKFSGFLAQIAPLAGGELSEILNGPVEGKNNFSLSEILCPGITKQNSPNVAIILLARASARTAEMAIRSALGAGRGALIRQLLAEGLAYAVVGGVASIGVAYAGVRVLKAMAPGNAPRMAEASVNPAVLLFTLALVVGTAILFGLVPALRASRTNAADALRASGRGSTSVGRRWLEAFVALEFALTCALLAGSGLLLRSYVELNRVRPGFDANNLVSGDYYLPYFSYGKPEQRVVFQKKDRKSVV